MKRAIVEIKACEKAMEMKLGQLDVSIQIGVHILLNTWPLLLPGFITGIVSCEA